ncbi:glycoside hydrolase family 13 protein [Mycena latifolia]|nr:glycoside hydrolase family 13 protein [Mycena latifolia]
MLRSFILPALLLASPALAASAVDWSTKSVYQLVTDRFATSNDSSTSCDTSLRTYCGGSWVGITNHLDYIQNMGFDAVWISPVVTNADDTAYGDGYHGYWSRDIDTVSPRFGTAADLKALSAALHTRGMYLMLDVVINHYAGVPTNTTVSLSGLFTFDFASLLPLGTEADFHSQCFISDYTNQTDVEQCWLGDQKLPLPDVDTEDATIVATLNTWIKDTVAEYGIDGVRIDTVKHIRHDFWSDFTASAGVFTLGEVLSDNATYAASYLGAVDAVLDYPAWYQLITAFASTEGNLSALEARPALAPPSSAGSVLSAAFLENHDQPRFPSYTSDTALTKNAMTWPFVGDGMPILYYGQEQGYGGGADPANREALWLSGYETNKPLVAHVKALNAVRKLAVAANASFLTGGVRLYQPPSRAPLTPLQASWVAQPNPSAIMLSKPPLLTLFTNVGANASVQPTWSIPAGLYAANTTLVDVLACVTRVVDGAGGATVVSAQAGLPQVLIPASMLSASGGACPALATTGSSGAPRGRVMRGLAVLGAMLGVVALV